MPDLRCRVGPGLVAMLLGWLLAGCEGLQPYRTAYTDPDQAPVPICNPDPGYNVPEGCRTNIHERSDLPSGAYDLFFTEFTDQGLQFPSEIHGEAGYQINHTLKGLKRIAEEPGVRGVSVIVFVHGWKHNASHGDDDVRDFRKLLQAAASLEQARGSGYRVVGVYVGWRGRSLEGEPLANLSFWARKATALRVAQGSTRELFNRLRSFKCAQNRVPLPGREAAGGSGACTELAGDGPSRSKVRMLMIGHSFGAAILYNAVSGSLIESITHDTDTGVPNTVNLRYADMVVLLNPAFEASQYTPLHRVATTADYSRYQPPLLVSVTSTTDWATGRAFPAGRFINSIFEKAANPEEGEAIKRTMGHVPRYITHDLTNTGGRPAECAGWEPLGGIADSERRRDQAMRNLRAEEANTRGFLGTRVALDRGWERTFCGGARLRHVEHRPNSVIWNVRADHTIMDGHNDISRSELVDFVRQLYHDTLIYPLPTRTDAASPAPDDGPK